MLLLLKHHTLAHQRTLTYFQNTSLLLLLFTLSVFTNDHQLLNAFLHNFHSVILVMTVDYITERPGFAFAHPSLMSNSSSTERNAEVWGFPQTTVSSVWSQALGDAIILFFLRWAECLQKRPGCIWWRAPFWARATLSLCNLFLDAGLAVDHYRTELWVKRFREYVLYAELRLLTTWQYKWYPLITIWLIPSWNKTPLSRFYMLTSEERMWINKRNTR